MRNPTGEELYEVFEDLPDEVRREIIIHVKKYRTGEGQCPLCGEDCTCRDAADDFAYDEQIERRSRGA